MIATSPRPDRLSTRSSEDRRPFGQRRGRPAERKRFSNAKSLRFDDDDKVRRTGMRVASTAAMKATTLLERQHRKVEAIFKKLESGRSNPEPLLTELADDLAAHMAIEHRFFYPVARRIDESLILESFEEHALAEIALKRLLATDPQDPSFKARVTALKELIEHHVEEEEEELFPKVEKKVDEHELLALGKEMKTAFEEIVEQGYAAAIPKGGKTTADVARKHLRANATVNGHAR